jgi:hypothetical protein
MPAIASQPDLPVWDVDADWWGPTWDVVTSAGPAEPAGSGKSYEAAPQRADQAVPVPATSCAVTAEPSWGQVLATTVSLWAQRHRPSAGAPHVQSPGLSAPGLSGRGLSGRGLSTHRLSVCRPRVAGWASAVWGAHARLLSAAMLSAGLLAAGAGMAGLVVAHASSAPSVRLAARPSPVAVPSGRTVLPVSLSAVAQAPKPVWLTIPAIGVKAPIVTLGLNRNGTLQVPSTTTVVGWYTNSPRPGATGSAVIAGHVDSRSGPGVFFWLRTMRPGERIYVRRADGTLAVFTVTAVRTYAKARFPTATVYGPVPDAELRLITCGGTFDYARGSYLSNVVVYARLSG